MSTASSRATALRILDRGLFVLLVGHVLVCGSLLYKYGPGAAFQRVVITDTIGLLLCTTPLLWRTRPRHLMASGAALFAPPVARVRIA